jgi:elongation factor Ts
MSTQDGTLGTYMHGSRIGVMVETNKSGESIVKDIAMHIAASRPLCVDEKGVAPELLEKEKEIFSAQAQSSGKPADIIEKMVQGRIKKFISEVTLLGQPYVKDPDITVAKLLQQHKAEVRSFTRYEVGEGIEKKSENFADEVMKQVQGS